MPSQATLLVTIGLIGAAVGGIALAFSGGLIPGQSVGSQNASADPGALQSNLDETNASFRYSVDSVTECGATCREVSGTLTNNGTAAATNVTVQTRVYAGGDLLWEGGADAGRLAPEESYTDTKTIELSLLEGQQAKANGEVTFKTIVRFDGGTKVFTAVQPV